MAKFLYGEREKQLLAPPFTRMRHPYRGGRESYKMNLEADQFAFSVRKLFRLIADFKDKFLKGVDSIPFFSKGVVESLQSGDSETGASDSDETPLLFVGFDKLEKDLRELDVRLRSLEEK